MVFSPCLQLGHNGSIIWIFLSAFTYHWWYIHFQRITGDFFASKRLVTFKVAAKVDLKFDAFRIFSRTLHHCVKRRKVYWKIDKTICWVMFCLMRRCSHAAIPPESINWHYVVLGGVAQRHNFKSNFAFLKSMSQGISNGI